MTIKDCPNCGGTHFGTFKCPFTPLPCVVCGTPTIWACSDCAIEGKGSVRICNHAPCRGEHEQQNPQHPIVNAVTARASGRREDMKCSMPGLFANILHDLRDRKSQNAGQYEVALEEIIGHVQDVAAGRHTIQEFTEHYCIPALTSGKLDGG